MFSVGEHPLSRLLQSIIGLCSSNHGKPSTVGCLGLRIILKETMHPKSPKSMCIGSDASNIFPEAMGRPSITTTDTGQGSLRKGIWCFWAKSLSMKQELAPVSKRAWTWSWQLGVLTCTWAEKTVLTCLEEMEPLLRILCKEVYAMVFGVFGQNLYPWNKNWLRYLRELGPEVDNLVS